MSSSIKTIEAFGNRTSEMVHRQFNKIFHEQTKCESMQRNID